MPADGRWDLTWGLKGQAAFQQLQCLRTKYSTYKCGSNGNRILTITAFNIVSSLVVSHCCLHHISLTSYLSKNCSNNTHYTIIL